MMKRYMALAALPLLAACMAEMDMQGKNPQTYYKEHPIKNRVETRSESHLVHFSTAGRMTAEEIGALRAGLSSITPQAAESVQVQMHPSQMHNEARKQHLTKLLQAMGYTKRSITFEPLADMEKDAARLDITYAAVISPRCPDWRTSSVTTYSNTQQGGFRCANETNLGLMVMDPHDLVRGQATSAPDLERNAVVLENYRTNQGASSEDAAPAAESTAPSTTTQ